MASVNTENTSACLVFGVIYHKNQFLIILYARTREVDWYGGGGRKGSIYRKGAHCPISGGPGPLNLGIGERSHFTLMVTNTQGGQTKKMCLNNT